MSVTAIIKLTANPGQRGALQEAMVAAVIATGEHPQCLAIEMLAGIENEDELLLIETWASVQDHQDYINSVIAAGGLEGIRAMLASDIETWHYA